MFGVHQSFENPMSGIPLTAQSYGATTFQIFIRNNRNMKRRYITREEIAVFNQMLFMSDISTYLVHAPYALNPCTDDEYRRIRYADILREDMDILNHMAGIKYYVLHPGSAKDLPVEVALQNLYKMLQSIESCVGNTYVAVEWMAGAGTQMLCSYDQVDYFRRLCSEFPWVCLCYDTCHVFASGNDLYCNFDMFKDFIGAVHLNDSQGAFGTYVDRHVNLGRGVIGSDNLLQFARHVNDVNPNVPIVLETPGVGLFEDFLSLKDTLT